MDERRISKRAAETTMSHEYCKMTQGEALKRSEGKLL